MENLTQAHHAVFEGRGQAHLVALGNRMHPATPSLRRNVSTGTIPAGEQNSPSVKVVKNAQQPDACLPPGVMKTISQPGFRFSDTARASGFRLNCLLGLTLMVQHRIGGLYCMLINDIFSNLCIDSVNPIEKGAVVILYTVLFWRIVYFYATTFGYRRLKSKRREMRQNCTWRFL